MGNFAISNIGGGIDKFYNMNILRVITFNKNKIGKYR